MSARYDQIFRRHCRAVRPRATGLPTRVVRLPEIRAVLFDVYGTLLISGSGEVGTAGARSQASAVRDSLAALDPPLTPVADLEPGLLEATIRQHHARSREAGIEFPEVDIVAVWREVVERLVTVGTLGAEATRADFARLAVEYEARTNPVWPMPGMVETLREVGRRGCLLGIVSNAQFFTPRLFPALTGQSLDDLGFDPELRYYSYAWGRAKPGAFLFRRAAQACAGRGIAARQVLYLGNDMLNDVRAAQRVGFRTALYAGDRRSLRLREQDPRVADVTADVVLDDLPSLAACL